MGQPLMNWQHYRKHMEIDQNTFASLCFVVLMDHHGNGYRLAHPEWIKDKSIMLTMGYDAWGMLDVENQCYVRGHLKDWGYQMPRKLQSL